MAAPRPTLGHYQGGSLTHLMLITCVLHIRPKGHREPCNEVRSLSLAKCLVGFEPGTFQFQSQRLNPLGHSSQRYALIFKGMLTFLHIVYSKNRTEAWRCCAAKKKQERYEKCGSNDDQSWHVTVRDCGSSCKRIYVL